MGNKHYGGGKPTRYNKCCKRNDGKNLAFIMIVFGLVSVCAFFLPIKAWILLLGGLLIYCGWKLNR